MDLSECEEEYKAVASSAAHYVRIAASILWGMVRLVYGFSCGSPILFEILAVNLAVILRIIARHAETGALMLESADENIRGRAVERPSIQDEETAYVASQEVEVVEIVVDMSEAEKSMAKSDSYEFHHLGVNRRSEAIKVGDAHTILTNRQAGRARIRVLRERRRQNGLKV